MKRTAWERFTSRPFLLAVVGSIGALISYYRNVPVEVIGIFTAPIFAFIVGESYKDGKAEEFVAPPLQQAMIENRADALAKMNCEDQPQTAAPASSVIANAPVLQSVDLSDVDETGVQFPPEDDEDEPLLGVIDHGTVLTTGRV